MASFSRSSALSAVVIAVLLAALPGAIRRIIQTGDPYLFTQDFFADLVARLLVQRMRLSCSPRWRSYWAHVTVLRMPGRGSLLVFHGGHRAGMLRDMFASVRNLAAIAILLDVASQFIIFREVHPGAALLLGPVLIAFPYALSRAQTGRRGGEVARNRPPIHADFASRLSFLSVHLQATTSDHEKGNTHLSAFVATQNALRTGIFRVSPEQRNNSCNRQG
jgi:hypothetical protein